MAERCGFEMRYQAGAGDQYYWLWFFKPAGRLAPKAGSAAAKAER